MRSRSEDDLKRKRHNSISSDEENGGKEAYEVWKNRKKNQRKKIAESKKKLAAKAKASVDRRKKAKENGEEKPEGIWGPESDFEGDDTIPEYITQRRKTFDRNQQILHEAGLRLPPSYDEIDFSDNERLAELEERPVLPSTIDTSRPYKISRYHTQLVLSLHPLLGIYGTIKLKEQLFSTSCLFTREGEFSVMIWASERQYKQQPSSQLLMGRQAIRETISACVKCVEADLKTGILEY